MTSLNSSERTLNRTVEGFTRGTATQSWRAGGALGLLVAVLATAGCGGSSEPLGGSLSDGGIGDNGGNNGSGLDGGYPDGGCQPMSLQSGTSVDGYNSDVYSWYDSDCRPRSAALVRNNAADPGGSHGGYLRALSYQADGQTRHAVGQPGVPWNGWGYVVNHYGMNSDDTSHDKTGTYRTVLNGTHHSIHEFKVRVSPGGPVDVTIHWFFATGRSNPIYAITHDSFAAGADVVRADARAPYGNLTFDGATSGDSEVAGVGWGDQYRFSTTGAGPVTFNSPWDYSGSNTVPYTVMWSRAADAEMGAVQTQTFAAHVSGGDYGEGLLANCWNHTSASPGSCTRQAGGTMLIEWLWPFQLNQYELPFVTTSKRMAWGMNFGAVGQRSYSAFGRSLVGYPYQSYSVYLVLGKRTEHPTDAQTMEVAAAAGASLTATVGTVVTSGPGGVGRSDNVPYSPAGYDPIYGTWLIAAASGSASFRFDPGAGSLLNPIFRIQGWTSNSGPRHVQLAGAELSPYTDYFTTVDAAHQELWLTLNRRVSSPQSLSVQP